MKYNVLIFLINIIVVNCGIYNYNIKYITKDNIENFILIKNKIIKNIIDCENKIITNSSNINILDIAMLFN